MCRDEVEQIRKELKESSERRIKSIKEYYEWKIEELAKADGATAEKLNNSNQMESMELKTKISELEAAMTSLRIEKEQNNKVNYRSIIVLDRNIQFNENVLYFQVKDFEAENIKLKQELMESKDKIAVIQFLLFIKLFYFNLN